MLDLAFRPHRGGPAPLFRQLAAHLRELVRGGRLRSGEKLPATRELAATLGVSRKTVAQAYEALVDEGVLLAHVGQGTFVSSRAAARGDEPLPTPRAKPFAWEALFSRSSRSALLSGLIAAPAPEVELDFRGGRVDADSLPLATLGRAWSWAVRQRLAGVANDFHPLGYRPLRDQIARTLVSRGIGCAADDVLVTSGAQQGLDLVARVLVEPGDAVALEQPGYFGAALAFQAAGAHLIGLDVDGEGLRTDSLARALRSRRIKLIYTTPAAQMPTGAVLGEARRQALLELADETQTPVLEDDYDSEFRHGDPPEPALKTEDAAGQVIYLGTFSKALYPGLRIGYVVAAPPLLERLAAARFQATQAPDLLAQVALSELLARGAVERHVRRLRKRYAERLQALLDALETSMPSGTLWSHPRGGLLVWITLPPGVDGDALERRSREQGIAYLPGRCCFVDGRDRGHLGLSFACLPPESIRVGMARLGELVAQFAVGRRFA